MRWILGLIGVAAFGTCLLPHSIPRTLHANDTAYEASTDVAGLKDTLEKGLRAQFPQDLAFIAKVVMMVDNNELPLDVVIGTYDWVRKNRSYKKYLMPYFEQVLRSRAAQLGVQI